MSRRPQGLLLIGEKYGYKGRVTAKDSAVYRLWGSGGSCREACGEPPLVPRASSTVGPAPLWLPDQVDAVPQHAAEDSVAGAPDHPTPPRTPV